MGAACSEIAIVKADSDSQRHDGNLAEAITITITITLLRAKIDKKMLEFSSSNEIENLLERAVDLAVGLFNERWGQRVCCGFVKKGRGCQRAVKPFA